MERLPTAEWGKGLTTYPGLPGSESSPGHSGPWPWMVTLSFGVYDASKEEVNHPTSDQGCRLCPQLYKACWDFSASPRPEAGKATQPVTCLRLTLTWCSLQANSSLDDPKFPQAQSGLLSQFYVQ